MSTIAFLGLGHMGGPMSANLVAAGHTVRGFDPVAAAADAAADKGVVVCDSAAVAVSDAEVVFTMLPHGEAVKRCYAEILPAARQGALFIDSSTISVDDAREVHALAGVARLRPARRAGLRRGQRRGRRHSGLHGRRRRG